MAAVTRSSPAFVAVPYISLFNSGILMGGSEGEYLQIDRHFLHLLLYNIIPRIKFEEEWYLRRYPDIVSAIESGNIANARIHYIKYGYFENRMPYQITVNADWYLEQYNDVLQAIERRDFSSAQAHFDEVGFAEGRLPYPRFSFSIETANDLNGRPVLLSSGL